MCSHAAVRSVTIALSGNDPEDPSVAEILGHLALKVDWSPSGQAVRVLVDGTAGAEVLVDREDLGGRGLSPRTLALPAGPHTVVVRKEGYRRAEAAPAVARVVERLGAEAGLDAVLRESLKELASK